MAKGEISSQIVGTSVPLANLAIISMLTLHCEREDERAREMAAHQPSYAKVKKIKSLTLQTHDCPMASLMD